jgi:ADP-ribose pyrophosphatase
MASPGGGAGDEGDDAHLVERRLGSQTLLEGGFLHVCRDTVVLPDGGQATREYIRHPGAVTVLPLLDDGRIVLARQFRYAVGRVLLELPAGKIDPGEPTWRCAERELAEETGYVAREWACVGRIHNAAAYSDEFIELWFARGLSAGDQRLDDGEFIEVAHLTPDQLDALAAAGELPDAKTLIGLMWWQRWQAGAWKLQWQPPGGPGIAP